MAFIQPTSAGAGFATQADWSSNPFVTGFQLTQTGTRTFTISPGAARAYASSAIISFPTVNLTSPPLLSLNLLDVGALGCYPWSLDQLGLSERTSLGVYILGDSKGVNLPTAVVATGDDFVLPGYDLWRRIGSIYVNTDLTMRKFVQSGSGTDRSYVYIDNLGIAEYGPTVNFPIPLNNSGGINPYFVSKVLLTRTLTANNFADFGATTPNNSGAFPDIFPYKIQSPAVGGGKLTDSVWVEVSKIGNEAYVYLTLQGAECFISVEVNGWCESLGLQAI